MLLAITLLFANPEPFPGSCKIAKSPFGPLLAPAWLRFNEHHRKAFNNLSPDFTAQLFCLTQLGRKMAVARITGPKWNGLWWHCPRDVVKRLATIIRARGPSWPRWAKKLVLLFLVLAKGGGKGKGEVGHWQFPIFVCSGPIRSRANAN